MDKKLFRKLVPNKMPLTGDVNINVQEVINHWDETFWVAQWDKTYRLIKYVKLGKEDTDIKISISPVQAQELIDKLNLQPHKEIFNSATTWKL